MMGTTVFALTLVMGCGLLVKALLLEDYPAENDVIFSCLGDRASFGWTFRQIDGNEEQVVSLHWEFCDGLSTEIIASVTSDQFFPKPSYMSRLNRVSNAGLSLSDVTLDDEGNYTVQVNSINSSGSLVVRRRTVYLQVGDGLMLRNGSLEIRQDPEAVWDSVKKTWVIRLLCGDFTYLGAPPVDVIWTSPTGKQQGSLTYANGNFVLEVSTPVTGGEYTCQVDHERIQALCLTEREDAPAKSPVRAVYSVNEFKIRMSLFESELKKLRIENRELQENKTRLSEQLTSYVKERIEDEVNVLKQQGQYQQTVAFHATLTTHTKLTGTLVMPRVVTNLGNHYNTSSGIFTTPVAGLYFFSAMSTVAGPNHKAYLRMDVDGETKAYCYAYQESSHYQTGTCNAVLHMDRGQNVLVRSAEEGWFWGPLRTTFSGFLIKADLDEDSDR